MDSRYIVCGSDDAGSKIFGSFLGKMGDISIFWIESATVDSV